MTTEDTRPIWQMPAHLPQAVNAAWEYITDDGEVEYQPGWWPFKGTRNAFGGGQPAGVRIAPDICYYAWGHEYVTVFPSHIEGRADTTVSITDGTYARTVTVGLFLDDQGSWMPATGDEETFVRCERAGVGYRFVADKAHRVCAYLNKVTAHRDSGAAKPVQAYDSRA